MQNKLFLLIVAVFFAFSAKAQQYPQLSAQAQISLITCDPGTELYSAFGHSAIRVNDPVLGLDKAYNYGTFSFDTPNFYLKFVRGQLNYQLSVAPFSLFLRSYRHQNRSVYEQVLNLTPERKQQIFNFLQNNALPENKFYLYDFFFDNCATRVRDVFTNIYGDSLKFKVQNKKLTFRDLIQDPYLENRHWEDFGIDLLLGALTDRQATPNQYMFLPDYMFEAFDKAMIEQNGESKNFVARQRTLFKAKTIEQKTSFFTPFVVFALMLLLVLALTFWGYRKQRAVFAIDFFLFFVTGLLGIVVSLAWFATDHTVTVQNYNLLWAMPLNWLVAFVFLRKNKPRWLRYYVLIFGALQVLTLAFWWLIPQKLHLAVIPILLALVVRCLYLFFRLKPKEK